MVRSTCSDCHTPGYALQQRFDLNGWRSVLDVMERISIDGTYRGDDADPQPDIAAHKEELAQYLARIRGPSAGELHLPSGRQERRRLKRKRSRIALRSQFSAPLGYQHHLGMSTRHAR